MSSRWRVWSEYPGGWLACPVEGGTLGDLMEFRTHAEAMTYADHRARTITVALPRVGRQTQIPVPEDYGNERPISVGNHGDFISAVFTAQGLTQDVAIHPEELEPLALTLLALARKGDSGGA